MENYHKNGVYRKGASCLDGDTKARNIYTHDFPLRKRRTSRSSRALRVLEAFFYDIFAAKDIHTYDFLFGNVERFSCVARFRGFLFHELLRKTK